MKQEFTVKPISGYLALLITILFLGGAIAGFAFNIIWLGVVLSILFIFMTIGFKVVNPNGSLVMVLFGAYKGTIRENGFYWVNPFYVTRHISLRARNFDSEPIKVNDKIGNPIKIGFVLVWKVLDTYKAVFDVDDYQHFVLVQSDAALRKLAGLYPYDNFEDHEAEIALRSGGEEINEELEKEIRERLLIAGIEVIEARINYIAYAEEIANAMLRRQQATAVVAARFKIVEGAVSMVQMALEQLSDKNIVELDEEKKAAMVSNLMVVLCGDKDATPVVNTGTLHS
ncbi:MAG TPA: SPFH domain-containing protein [Bacteroidales bacterium]|jgi:regulator of protease activity HflC (stomatin/prohibitin superfamily)|nr:SPFH domain-containing protein [Bacteroidales bacterium]OQB65003.1 MAG: SPFH domain / Band 7 family protein [Bacteroidetes bacterium ADurb.Bin145]NMD03020.1 SPFH domain-containing protein [Bacteroidales bacterium]HOU01597.1 SPFH domain-containing protein [Bacteroidales bacterium]HQG62428.1 SPFH domain-containing protein [Bacteroidales bacterium]